MSLKISRLSKKRWCKRMTLKKSNYYRAFGYTIHSEIALPELITINFNESLADIEIKVTDLTKVGKELFKNVTEFVFNNKQVLFHIPNIATFSIEDGKKIHVSPIETGREEFIRLLLLGTCMGIVLMQRGRIPLHGSVVAIENKAYAIIGESGAGKSTLAAAFLNQGYKLLTDDVISITFIDDQPYVIPSYPQQKLWKTILTKFGMSHNQYNPIYERETKYAVPVHSDFLDEPLPLASVFEMEKDEGNEIKCYPIEGLDQLKMLYNHTYRNFLISKLGLLSWHFHESVKIINAVNTYKVIRPKHRFTAYELTELILKRIEGGKENVNKLALIK
jgi:hypothetical protein